MWQSPRKCKFWSGFPFWQALTLYLPTVPTAPRWCNKWNGKQSSQGWHYYYAQLCDDVCPKQTQKLKHRHTHPRCTLPYPTSCCWRRDKFSLRDFAFGGLHTLLWELLWHNSCSLILPTHSSVGHTIQYSVFFLWGGCYLLVLHVSVHRVKVSDCDYSDWEKRRRKWKGYTKRKQKKHRQRENAQTPSLVTGSGSSFVRVLFCRLHPRQCVWLRCEALRLVILSRPRLLSSS